ncbi:MAG TPA: sugar ABC transporter ATP-binding protein [Anaeromyxobacter sp.]|nr:sugar ABC transporter ATP-binding protein [Anaeromyxobacter sp.]
MSVGAPRLELRGVRKRYDATLALRDVDLTIDGGEVHALAGENGAGKSTLIKVLGGAVRRDAGTIALDGTAVDLATPLESRAAGIRVVYQEFSLVPTVSVTENVLLGQMPTGARGMWIDWNDAHRRAAEAIASLGFEVPDVRRRVGSLPVSQRQMVEIAKALLERPRILVLDEPSAVLSSRDLERLFAAIRSLRQGGGTVIYVSHRLDEVFAIADRITVLKDGARVGTLLATEVDQQGLVRMMVGRSLGEVFPARTPPASPVPVLVVRGLSRRRAFHDVSLDLSPGEIVGVSGLVGSGRTELVRAIAGADRPDGGEMALDGRPYHPRSPAEGLHAGVAMLSEDRARDGLVPAMSVRDNLSLASFARMSRLGVLLRRVQEALVGQQVRELNVRTASVDAPVRRLSGGNQQKAMVGRWLLRGARVLLLDEPTRGVDVGAKAEIYRLVAGLAERGMAVLLVSSELPEVLGMSDRILVMRGGRIVARFQRGEATEERLLAAAAGVAPEEA